MTSRREFIRISALGLGAFALAGGTSGLSGALSMKHPWKNLNLILQESLLTAKFASGNAPAGSIRTRMGKSGRSPAMTLTPSVTADFVRVAQAVWVCTMTKTGSKLP
jgi:hypothetical protein